MLTFICKEEKGIVVEAKVIGDKPDGELYGDESSLEIVDNGNYIDIDTSEEYAEDEDGEEYEYEQINVTIPFNKIVKTDVYNTRQVTPHFFRDFGLVFLTDDFKQIRLATT